MTIRVIANIVNSAGQTRSLIQCWRSVFAKNILDNNSWDVIKGNEKTHRCEDQRHMRRRCSLSKEPSPIKRGSDEKNIQREGQRHGETMKTTSPAKRGTVERVKRTEIITAETKNWSDHIPREKARMIRGIKQGRSEAKRHIQGTVLDRAYQNDKVNAVSVSVG